MWQDFHMLVANPRKQKLHIQVKDSLGFADLNIGVAEVLIFCPFGVCRWWLQPAFRT